MVGRCVLVTLVACIALAPPAHPWGDQGHELICEMAFRELTEKTRGEVKRLIGLDPEFSTFSESCTWADGPPRRRSKDHFLNLPRHYTYVGTADCRLASRCVFTGIRDDVDTLSRDSASDSRKLEALKLLGHWVGDIHQPLHVSFKDDRGGNEIREDSSPPCSGNLHRVWDSCILQERVLVNNSIEETASELLGNLPTDAMWIWGESTMVHWADESFKISIDDTTAYCTRVGGICAYDTNNRRLDEGEPLRTFFVDEA